MILTVTMNPAIDKIYMVNYFNLGGVHRPLSMIASAGGKGLNVARVVKLMGEKVGATGPLGGGNGLYIEKKIRELGIECLFSKIEEESRICINISDLTKQQSTEVLENGPVMDEMEIARFLENYEGLMGKADIIALSGSLSCGLPIDFYRQLIEIANSHQKKVLLDTSGDAFVQGLKAIPYLIKPNEDELEKVYDLPSDTLEEKIKAINYFKKLGITLPIISMGKDGSLAGLSDGIYKVSTPLIKVINPVGSGDAYVAGCAVGLQRGYSEIDILKLATACGAANTQFEHTGFVTREMVTMFFEKVTVNKIADYGFNEGKGELYA